MGIQPFQAVLADGTRVLLVGYEPESHRFLAFSATGEVLLPLGTDVRVDWTYDADSDAWRMNSQSEPTELLEDLGVAINALVAIAEYDHTPTCRNREEFSVWDCNCNALKPDRMALLALQALEGTEEPDAEPEEVSVSPLPESDPT